LSPWPVTLLLSIPYILVVAQGDEILGPALLLGALLGGVLAVAFTGFGMLVSIWSNSNKMSLFVSLFVYLIFLIPTQFPGTVQKGDLGYSIQQLNPMQASSEFLEKVLVNNRTVAEKSPYLVAAILSAIVVTGVLFLYAAPRLHLEGNAPRLPRLKWGRAANLLLIAGLVISLALFPAVAQAAQGTDAEQALEITLDLPYTTVNAGDEIEFNTVVTNNGTEESPPMNVAMNIVKTGKGDPVDPEDWSPERTQGVDPLAPGESAEQTWTIDAILEGDYMVYMTIIPQPDGPESTSQPVSSQGLHLIVKAFNQTNPGGVLPVAIITPLALILLSFLPRRRWRRRISTGSPETAE
jgi:CARDB